MPSAFTGNTERTPADGLSVAFLRKVIGVNVAETTLVQLTVPRHLQGRVRASYIFAIGALAPVAGLVAGLLGTTIGLRATLIVAAALIPFSMFWFIRSPLLRLRTVEPAAAEAVDLSSYSAVPAALTDVADCQGGRRLGPRTS